MLKDDKIDQRIDRLIDLMQRSVAIQLYSFGMSKEDIRKNLKINQNEVFQILKGLKYEKK